MIVWLEVNVLLTVLALGFARLNAAAPHRLRFFVCFAALGAWLIPWGWLGRLLPAGPALPDILPAHVVVPMKARPSFGLDSAAGPGSAQILAGLEALLLAASIVGIVLFAASAVRYSRLVRRLARESASAEALWSGLPGHADNALTKKLQLRIQRRIPGALTTGLREPIIWIHEDLVNDPGLRAAIVHECRHVECHDNAYLWVITFVERLLWWNPLVRYLGSRVRRLQELSCDEACAKACPDYRGLLNCLIMSLSGARTGRRPCPQAPFIRTDRNFNVQRVRMLERSYPMSKKHYASTGVLLAGALLVIGLAAAQERGDEAPQKDSMPLAVDAPISVDEVLRQNPELSPIRGFEPGTTMDEANEKYRSLKLYVTLLERQYDTLSKEHKTLKAELEALQAGLGEDR